MPNTAVMTIAPLREKDYLDIRNALRRLDKLSDHDRYVFQQLEHYVNYPLNGRVLARSGIVSILATHLLQFPSIPSLKLVLRLLTEIFAEMSAYRGELQRYHYAELRVVMTVVPDCVLYVVRLTGELVNFDVARQEVIRAGLHCLLADLVVHPTVEKDIVNAALGALSRAFYRSRVAHDDFSYNALIELDMCSRFVQAAKRWLAKAVFGEEDKSLGDIPRLAKLMKTLGFTQLPQPLDVCFNWAALFTLLIDEDQVFARAQHQQGPDLFEALELILPYAIEAFGTLIVKRLTVWVETANSQGICCWLVRAGAMNSILRRYRIVAVHEPDSMEQRVVRLVIGILRTMPDHLDIDRYENNFIEDISNSNLGGLLTQRPPAGMKHLYKEFAQQINRLRPGWCSRSPEASQ